MSKRVPATGLLSESRASVSNGTSQDASLLYNHSGKGPILFTVSRDKSLHHYRQYQVIKLHVADLVNRRIGLGKDMVSSKPLL